MRQCNEINLRKLISNPRDSNQRATTSAAYTSNSNTRGLSRIQSVESEQQSSGYLQPTSKPKQPQTSYLEPVSKVQKPTSTNEGYLTPQSKSIPDTYGGG